MHILIIPSWYKTNKNPLFGSFFEEQARGLMNLGYKVGIIYPSFYSFSSKTDSKNFVYMDNKLPTFYCHYKALIPKCYSFNYHLFGKKIYKTYLEYIEEYGRPNIIHAHSVFFAGIAAEYISKKTKIPFVITEHLTEFITGGIKHPNDLKISRKIFLNSKKNIVVSEGFKKLLSNKLNLSDNLFEVIPNMVNNLFFETDNLKKINKENPIFFTTSFLTERKNHILMLNAFKLLLVKFPNAVFRIGGDGAIREKLKKYVQNIGIDTSVEFLGELTRERMVMEMSKCDIFLLGSKFETFGVVLIEALAAGKPIITTDSVGPRDIVNVNNGIIVSELEFSPFYEAMMKMLVEYEKYDSQTIKNDCRLKFSEEKIINSLKTVYTNAINA